MLLQRDPRLHGKVLNITCVKQTIVIYKHNTPRDYNNYELCTYHWSFLWVWVIQSSVKKLTSNCLMVTKAIRSTAENSIQNLFKYKKHKKNMCILSRLYKSYILVSALSQKRKRTRDLRTNHVHSTWLQIGGVYCH